MSGWDASAIRSAPLSLSSGDGPVDMHGAPVSLSLVDAQNQFRQFLRTHQAEDMASFPYRDELRANVNEGQYFLVVDLNDLLSFSEELHQLLVSAPDTYVPILEIAAKEVALQVTAASLDDGVDEAKDRDEETVGDRLRKANIQIQLRNYPRITQIRQLAADHVGKLVTIRGIVVSASRPRIKATSLHLMCRNCKSPKILPCGAGFGGARFPRTCDTNISQAPGAAGLALEKCPLDPYVIVADSSEYVDQQRLKLQENPDAVPTGELPRHISLALDRYIVGSVKPGTRIAVVGMYTTYEAVGGGGGGDKDQRQQGASDAGIRIPYLRVMGIEQENEATDVMLGQYTAEDEDDMRRLSQSPNLYDQITGSICPAIFDNEDTKNIKQSIAVQLFGGSRKQLPDGMRLRGDINVLLLGDPSVAKSQFLKFAAQVAPIGVYTSGKGASAAGLTASVIRDPSSGEFHLEGGALVLADGGLVCIDEFDKMREQDRVAIHEAMEQQTISIAKAGITTILNSRTSVLAAANPVFGRYDDMRSATENIDFQTTILSRFDLIFIIRDVQDPKRDENIVRFIFDLHNRRDAAVSDAQQLSGQVDIPMLKKYVAFARKTCNPRLNAEAAELLKNQYVKFRSNVQKGPSGSNSSIPITVRQLEAVIRISEARARMELQEEATTVHVQEALRLFQVQKAERELTQRIGIGQTASTQVLMQFLMDRNFERMVAVRALDFLVQRGQFRFKKQRKLVERCM